MKLLLDTHVWLWSVDRPNRLSREVRRQLGNSRNEIFLSPVSVWEAGCLERRGRVAFEGGFARWIRNSMQASPLQPVPFTIEVAMEANRIDLPQPDPGDLFLAATAIVYGLTLVTGDEQLLDCGWLKTLANG